MENRTKSTTHRPSNAAWRHYKNTIIDLYQNRILSDVMREMQNRYNFVATKRMYDTRFRRWKVTKVLKQAEKMRIAQNIAEQGLSGASRVTTTVSSKDLMKTMRWISSQSGTKDSLPQTDENYENMTQSPSRRSDSKSPQRSSHGQNMTRIYGHGRLKRMRSASTDVVSPSSIVSTTETSIEGSSSPTTSLAQSPDFALSSGVSTRALPSPSTDLIAYHSTPSPSPPVALGPEDWSQELLFRNVQLYALNRLERTGGTLIPAIILTDGASPATNLFWSNIKNGIYLLKIAASFPNSRHRVSSAIDEAKFLLPSVFSNELPLGFIRDILATLSPTNTDIQPSLRHDMLSCIAAAASASNDLGPLHPITAICDALHTDGPGSPLSSLALHVMIDTISDALGQSHPAYHTLMNMLIKMMRRGGDLGEARQMADGALSMARSECGNDSEQVRSAKVELSHILAKSGDHGRALSLAMDVATFPPANFKVADMPGEESLLVRCDTISIHAMEDIAEYYIRFGSTAEGVVWLDRAKTAAENVWGNTAATGHIADKLETVLRGDLCGQVTET